MTAPASTFVHKHTCANDLEQEKQFMIFGTFTLEKLWGIIKEKTTSIYELV